MPAQDADSLSTLPSRDVPAREHESAYLSRYFGDGSSSDSVGEDKPCLDTFWGQLKLGFFVALIFVALSFSDRFIQLVPYCGSSPMACLATKAAILALAVVALIRYKFV